MPSSADWRDLLAYSHHLPGGPRVHLRLARPRDAAGIYALLARQGHDLGALELARLVRFDPRQHCVICATALFGAHEAVIGIGSIALDKEGRPEPELLVVDDQLADGLHKLLRGALLGRAAAGGRRAA